VARSCGSRRWSGPPRASAARLRRRRPSTELVRRREGRGRRRPPAPGGALAAERVLWRVSRAPWMVAALTGGAPASAPAAGCIYGGWSALANLLLFCCSVVPSGALPLLQSASRRLGANNGHANHPIHGGYMLFFANRDAKQQIQHYQIREDASPHKLSFLLRAAHEPSRVAADSWRLNAPLLQSRCKATNPTLSN
jgi:hypothetical protein